MRGLIDIERKRYELIGCYTYYVAFSYDLYFGFLRWAFWKCFIIGMVGPIDMEWKGCESIGC